jgi:dimethylargininase
MRIAITRAISPAFANCELTHLQRQPIDVEVACEQHRRYEEALWSLGCELQTLPAEPGLPDSVFVEDTAIVLDDIAVMTRPGAASRQPETPTVAAALEPYRLLLRLEPPATMDGGDVLRIGRALFVGRTQRTNQAGIEQLRAMLAPYDYTVTAVAVKGCLHLKSGVTLVAPETLLLNSRWVDPRPFGARQLIEVAGTEPGAANGLLVGDMLVYPTNFPATRRRLEERNVRVRLVDVSEIQKAEGAVTCCSLVFDT